MPEIKVEELLHTSDELRRLAHPHKQGLHDTITSIHGIHTPERILRRLARSGHPVHRAAANVKTAVRPSVLKKTLRR